MIRGQLRTTAALSLAVVAGLAMAACGGSSTAPASHAPTGPATHSAAASRSGFQPAAASFVSSNLGWVLGQSGCQSCAALRVTTDGGHRWAALPAPPAPLGFAQPSAAAITDIAFANLADGFLYGPGLLATHDGGRSWVRQNLPPVQALGIGAGYSYALTRQGGSWGLWRAAIGSGRWLAMPLPPRASPSPASDYRTKLYVEGGTLALLRTGFFGPAVTPGEVGRLWLSTDDGMSWQLRHVPCRAPKGGGAAVLGIARGHPDAWLLDCFNNEQSSQQQNTQHHLFGTVDAGLSWTRLPDPTSHNMPYSLADNGSGHAFLATVGARDFLVGTLDGGLHWRTMIISGGNFNGWADLSFVTGQIGFVVAPTHYAREHLYRTQNGGRTWQTVNF